MIVAGWLLTIGIYCVAPALLGFIGIPLHHFAYWIGTRSDKPKSWQEESENALGFMLFYVPVVFILQWIWNLLFKS